MLEHDAPFPTAAGGAPQGPVAHKNQCSKTFLETHSKRPVSSHKITQASNPNQQNTTITNMQSTTPQSTSNVAALAASTGRRKKSFLNKFLTKTFHMLDQVPDDIASWSNGGDSFTIKDVDRFEATVLPEYFNHGKEL